jgi:hypothetical protein
MGFNGNLKTASGLLKYECGVSIDGIFFGEYDSY